VFYGDTRVSVDPDTLWDQGAFATTTSEALYGPQAMTQIGALVLVCATGRASTSHHSLGVAHWGH